MKIVSLDPSSSVIGYAVIDGAAIGAAALDAAGLITPADGRHPSYRRIRDMCADLLELLEANAPEVILIEWSKGKVGRRHKGRGAGLAVYGAGVGAALVTADTWSGIHGQSATVIPILENDWTRGVPKQRRSAWVAAQYPQYNPAQDPGGDVADAIGLARYWVKTSLLNAKR